MSLQLPTNAEPDASMLDQLRSMRGKKVQPMAKIPQKYLDLEEFLVPWSIANEVHQPQAFIAHVIEHVRELLGETEDE